MSIRKLVIDFGVCAMIVLTGQSQISCSPSQMYYIDMLYYDYEFYFNVLTYC